jgi:hypothetical protein
VYRSGEDQRGRRSKTLAQGRACRGDTFDSPLEQVLPHAGHETRTGQFPPIRIGTIQGPPNRCLARRIPRVLAARHQQPLWRLEWRPSRGHGDCPRSSTTWSSTPRGGASGSSPSNNTNAMPGDINRLMAPESHPIADACIGTPSRTAPRGETGRRFPRAAATRREARRL